MQKSLTNCSFCRKFGYWRSSSGHPIFDTILWHNDHFVVVPAVGSLTPGYVLIVTKTHVRSLGELPKSVLSELTQAKNELAEVIERYFQRPVFFEHGLLCDVNRAGACVDHAHLHCVPFSGELAPKLETLGEFTGVEDLDEIPNYIQSRNSYLYFEERDQTKRLLTDVEVPSQFVRRVIAESLDKSDLWDWAAFPFQANVEATIQILKDVVLRTWQKP